MSSARYSDLVWHQFKKYTLAYRSLQMLVALLLLAVFAPLLASDKPLLWRVSNGPWESPWFWSLFDRNVYEGTLDIVFNVMLVLGVPSFFLFFVGAVREPPVRTLRVLLVLFGILLLFTLFHHPSHAKISYPDLEKIMIAEGQEVTSVYPLLPFGFQSVDLSNVRSPISWAHPLGTDNAGRDVCTRMIYGTRISMTVGLFSVALYMVIGTILGALAGYYGGRVDALILRLIEVMLSIPSLFLILAMAAFVEKRSIFHVMLIIAAVLWTTPARLVRGEFMRLRSMEFVVAAVASGFGKRHIMFREMLPNALGPVLVTATFGVASSILIESTVSFLGLGDITVPSWGQILNTGRSTGMWTLILAPGIAIFITVSLLNLVGEGLRDAMDPKLRQ